MRLLALEGIVLKRRNIGEADKIITIFTKNFGKMNIKAKGVRKINSKRSAHIELFNYVCLVIYKNQNMPILTEISALETFSEVKASLASMGFGYHMCELIDKLCPEGQENQEVFELLLKNLHALCESENKIQLMNEFGQKLLWLLGYGNGLDRHDRPVSYRVEGIIEQKLKARQILPKLLE